MEGVSGPKVASLVSLGLGGWGGVTAGPCFATLASHCEWTSTSEPLENRRVTLSYLIPCLKADILTMAGRVAKTCLTPG